MLKRNGKITLLAFGLAIFLVTAIAAVPGLFSSVDSTAGYTVAGAAGSSGEALCSDGSHYNTACNVLGSAYYQTINLNGSGGYAQQPTLNFTGTLFSITNNAGNTGIGLISSGPGHIVATITATPGSSTAGAVFDGLGNIVPQTYTQTDETASRAFATSYQNTGGSNLQVSGYGLISGGSGDSAITCLDGVSSPTETIWANTTSGTVSSEKIGFSCVIPPGYYYEITATNLITSLGKWYETNY